MGGAFQTRAPSERRLVSDATGLLESPECVLEGVDCQIRSRGVRGDGDKRGPNRRLCPQSLLNVLAAAVRLHPVTESGTWL